tara:strand:- start:1271 stop:1534 length:264 start_codon:yes stop_codon:yes gene_type:complete
MSAETKAAFEAALQAHIADEMQARDGAQNVLVGAYVCKAHYNDLIESIDDSYSRYLLVKPDRQEYHVTYGLLLTAQDDFVGAELESD